MITNAFPGMSVKGMRGTTGRNGANPHIYASWLQKSIRRGIFDQAIYAAAGLYAFSTQERGKPLLTFLLNRLEIIAMEDIGLANPFLVDSIILKLEPLRTGPHGFSEIAGVVKALCESPKTRLSSWLKNVFIQDDCKVDVGPYGHIKHIFKLDPKELKNQKIGFDFSKLSYWVYQSGKSVKREWIYAVILLLIRPEKYVISDIPSFDCEHLFDKWVLAPEVLCGEMEDIVMDIHTGRKKRMDTSARYDFAVRGAYTVNEAILHPCHLGLKNYYDECKKTGQDIKPFLKPQVIVHTFKDSDIFTPFGQLIGFKTPTLFVKAIDNKNYFAKMLYPKTGTFALNCHLFRKKLGLFTKNSKIFSNILMTFDYGAMAPESSKNASIKNIGAIQKKCSNVVDLLMVEQVADGMNLCNSLKAGKFVDKLELIKVLLFRRYVQSTDTNSNNIVISLDGHSLSVDENQPNKVQVDRWKQLENPDTVFTAQKRGNLPKVYYESLKLLGTQKEEDLVNFLKKMKEMEFKIHKDEEWIDRMIVNKNWM